MSFSVSKSAPELVAPSKATPSGNLGLSVMDRMTVGTYLMNTVLVFKEGRDPANVVRDALSKVLVPYYPVAGRLHREDSGQGAGDQSVVVCGSGGDGVWFVEASADCSLADVNNLERPLMISGDDLIPSAPIGVNEEELTCIIQVTSFKCGGFAVGVRASHVVFDGIGAAQFLKAHGEMAMGLVRPTVEPIWSRESMPSPPKLPSLPGHLPEPSYDFVNTVCDIPADRVNDIKNQFVRETGRRCTTFDVITAILWKCRTRAIGFEEHSAVHIGFATNVRPLLHQVLPEEGYYGNCVYPIAAAATSGVVAGAPLVEVVGLIREAKGRVPSTFSAWLRGDLKDEENPHRMPLDYGTLLVTDWSRVGFTEVDYGWGVPAHVLWLNDDNKVVATSAYVRTSARAKAEVVVRVMSRCVEDKHLEAFYAEMNTFIFA